MRTRFKSKGKHIAICMFTNSKPILTKFSNECVNKKFQWWKHHKKTIFKDQIA